MKDFSLETIKELIEQSLKEQPTGDAWLDARYDEQFAIIAHSNPYYRLFYLIAKQLQPATVVELGGWQGTAAAHFAAGWPAAKVITIDHHSDPGDEHNKMKMIDVVRHYPNVNYVQGWTTPGYEEYHKGVDGWPNVQRVLNGNKIDILFIDSWHEGRYLRRDWDHYSPLLARPALVIIDDIFDNHLFVEMTETFAGLPGEKFTDGSVHPGIPMGFIHYGLSADRPDGAVEPEAARKPITRKPKSTRRRPA